MAWTDLQTAALKSFIERSFSFAETARKINREFGTEYTRNACIGRAQRMGFSGNLRKPAAPPEVKTRRVRENRKLRVERDKAKRWAAKPELADRAKVMEERAEASKRVRASCRSKTSPEYRNHLPKLPHMTRGELRAMLADAVANTAQMEQA